MTQQEKIYQLALSFVPGVGAVLMRNLVSYCGSAEAVFKANTNQLSKIPKIGEAITNKISTNKNLDEAQKDWEWCEKNGVKLLFYTDDEYPARLKRIYDAPALLYYHGSASLNAARTISLVGTRQATDYGKKITDELIEGLASLNVQVVSGLAYGIDIAAHRSSLKYNLETIGVMASGIDVIYPSQHQKTAEQMLFRGGLLTENRVHAQPEAPRFVARNRIIAGLSDVVVIVESARKGGGLITAEYANEYHREVFAVPGNLSNKYSEGCNWLIQKNKAQIYTSPQGIIEALNWDMSPEKTAPPALDLSQFTDQEAAVLSLLRQYDDIHIDDLAWQTQTSLNQLASLLLNLEFQGLVKSLPGKRYAGVKVKW